MNDDLHELEQIYGTSEPPAGELWSEWHVMCAQCHGRTSVLPTVDVSYNASLTLRGLGWKKTKADGWMCPECLKQP